MPARCRVSAFAFLLCFAQSLSPVLARAYPVGTDGAAIWPLEGHGASPGGADVPVTGSLGFNADGSIYVKLTVNGVPDAIQGLAFGAYVTDGPPGGDVIASGYAPYTSAVAPGFLHPMDATWGAGRIEFSIVDVQGVAWSGLTPNPSNPPYFFAPPYAPDASLFETRTIALDQERCDVFSASQSCPGAGVISTVQLFSVTIDRFVDPLPAPEVDPAVACALALAVIAARSVRSLITHSRSAPRAPSASRPA